MAKRSTTSKLLTPLTSLILPRSGDSLFYTLALLSLLSLLLHHLSLSTSASPSPPHFEGFGDDLDDLDDSIDDSPVPLTNLPPSPTLTQSDSQTHTGPPPPPPPDHMAEKQTTKSPSQFEYWDEDEFEGIPSDFESGSSSIVDEGKDSGDDSGSDLKDGVDESEGVEDMTAKKFKLSNYTIEIVCVSFLIVFVINYFTGRKENENLALAWAAKYATKDSIFEKNFSLLGVGEGDDSPLLLKEGQNVFKFYASGRRFCQGVLATMELKSRHDLISRVYNSIVPCKDEISFEVYMNDEAMDQVIFAVARKKLAKVMAKELPDLQRFAALMPVPANKKWVSEDLSVISESKEVAGDLINETVLDQVLGDKAFEKFGKYFISMHFSDQHSGIHKKKLVFKFALPDLKNMADMTRLVALVPYYIDLIGRYKLSSQARSKTDVARVKAAQEAYKELQYARQDALQRKKAEKKKAMEEAEAKLSAEAIRKREAKERARQMKKSMPKMKMTRAN